MSWSIRFLYMSNTHATSSRHSMITFFNFCVQIKNERRTCSGHDHGVGDAQFIAKGPIILQSSSCRDGRP
jgi:hypothetical protein